MPLLLFRLRFRSVVALFLFSAWACALCSRAAATPVFANAAVTPNALSAVGGKITVGATVTDSASPLSQVSALLFRNGLNYGSFRLTAGAANSYSGAYTLPQNTATTADVWTTRIYAVDAANHSATSDFKVTVPPDSGPAFANYLATPNVFPAAGGAVAVSANITDAGIGITQARVLLLKNGVLYGSFNLSAPVGGASFSGSALLPPNIAAVPATWTARLSATSAMNKTASADATLTQQADAGAIFSNLTVTPNPIGAGGGEVTFSANITDAGIGVTQATVAILKNGAASSTLTLNTAANGVYSALCFLPNDPAPQANLWTFRVHAVSAASVATTAPDFTLTQPGRSPSTVSGVVTLEGETHPAQSVMMNFRSTDNGVAQTRTVLLASDGSFALTDIPQGTYNLAIKGVKWLQTAQPIDTTGHNATDLTTLLRAGDANNDNSIDPTDFGLLVGAYGSDSSVAGSGYDSAVDFNDDGLINAQDFGLFVGNYGAQGDL